MKNILVSVLLALLATACQRASRAEETAMPAPPANEVWVTAKQVHDADIVTADVGERPVGNTLVATGRVTFSDSRVSHVFSPVTGRVTSLVAALGQTVQRGAPLAIIESPDLGTAASDLEKAEADLAVAERDRDRQKELYDAHAAAQRDYEAAESAYRKAKAERDRAARKSSLLSVSGGAVSQTYTLRAPIAGEIVARNAGLGMEVQGQYSGGTAPELFTIGNLDPVWIVADVFEVDLPRVRPGAPVTVNVVSYPDHPFHGRVDWISGTLDPGTRTAKVRCTIANGDRLLKPEMYASVSIATDMTPHLAIPRSAAVRMGDQTVAFVDKGVSATGVQRYEKREVEINDAQAGDFVPVLRGLHPGEKVVSSGAIILSGLAQ